MRRADAFKLATSLLVSVALIGVYVLGRVQAGTAGGEAAADAFEMRADWAAPFRPVDEPGYYVADREAGHVHVPHARREFQWPEHAGGRLLMTTNNMGFREDADTLPKPAPGTYRILVTGDSHTDGVVPNAESFCNVLEHRLNAVGGPRHYEVINGGAGFYGPFNYLGFVRKYLALEPDMIIVAFYTGNDFLDAIRTATLRRTVIVPPRSKRYFRMHELNQRYGAVLGQAVNSALFFQSFPLQRDLAVAFARQQLGAIRLLCLPRDIKLVVVMLPTKVDLEWIGHSNPAKSVVLGTLDLTENDMRVNQAMARTVTRQLQAVKIPVVDPLPVMRAVRQPLFWNRDYHLNTRGHRVVARVLYRTLRPLLGG